MWNVDRNRLIRAGRRGTLDRVDNNQKPYIVDRKESEVTQKIIHGVPADIEVETR